MTSCGNDPYKALKGEFSISETQKVLFSAGNLQYQASTKTYRFAPNQYDIIGEPNSNVSATYDGWIDLLSKGPADDPTFAGTNAYDNPEFYEFGKSLGEKSTWRTLSRDEWKYLVEQRPDAEKKHGVAAVNGVNGLIILPDSFTLPEGLTFKNGTSTGGGILNEETDEKPYNKYYKNQNSYTAEEWIKMEEAGAVFLPAAGYRFGQKIWKVGEEGYYRGNPLGEKDSYHINFSAYNIGYPFEVPTWGQSLRLVKPLQ